MDDGVAGAAHVLYGHLCPTDFLAVEIFQPQGVGGNRSDSASQSHQGVGSTEIYLLGSRIQHGTHKFTGGCFRGRGDAFT